MRKKAQDHGGEVIEREAFDTPQRAHNGTFFLVCLPR
jgi:hypothetical protein